MLCGLATYIYYVLNNHETFGKVLLQYITCTLYLILSLAMAAAISNTTVWINKIKSDVGVDEIRGILQISS